MRLWKVVNGELPEAVATFNELQEFERVIKACGLHKQSGGRGDNSLN